MNEKHVYKVSWHWEKNENVALEKSVFFSKLFDMQETDTDHLAEDFNFALVHVKEDWTKIFEISVKLKVI